MAFTGMKIYLLVVRNKILRAGLKPLLKEFNF